MCFFKNFYWEEKREKNKKRGEKQQEGNQNSFFQFDGDSSPDPTRDHVPRHQVALLGLHYFRVFPASDYVEVCLHTRQLHWLVFPKSFYFILLHKFLTSTKETCALYSVSSVRFY